MLAKTPVKNDQSYYLGNRSVDETFYNDIEGGGSTVEIASQAEAEAGTNNTKVMTALRTAQAIDAQVDIPKFSSQAEAEAGVDNTTIMSPLRVEQAINNFVETTQYREDLRFPATAVNPPGLISDPAWDTDIPGWLFDSGATEQLQLVAQLSHHYISGTEINPHVHWTKVSAGAGNVYWQMEYKWAKIGEIIDANWTTLSGATAIATTIDDGSANRHLITSLGTINDANADFSDMLIIKLSRVGGNAADTYGADARLLEFDLHCLYKIAAEAV